MGDAKDRPDTDRVHSDHDAADALDDLARFADERGYTHLRGTVNALARVFGVRIGAFHDLAMYGAKVTVYVAPPKKKVEDGDDVEWVIDESVDEPIDEDSDGRKYIKKKAIVFEPGVGEAPTGTKYYDPNKGEYTTPSDYPLGTVNVVRAPFGEDLLDDYVSSIETETSITPAEDPRDPSPHSYTAGW